MSADRIKSLRAAGDGQFSVEFFGSRRKLTSNSEIIQMALAAALRLDEPVDVETFEQSDTIKRVNAFDVARPARAGTISRLATQYLPLDKIHVLEVFVLQDDDSETQYRTPDPGIQRLCHHAAMTCERFVFEENDKVLTSVTVMGKPA